MTRKYYSRKSKVETKKNIRTGVGLIILSVIIITVLAIYGVPAVIQYAGIVTNISSSNRSIAGGDTTSPLPPHLDSLPGTTKENKIDINGSAEPGTDIVIVINSKKETTLVNKGGRFSYSAPLKKGVNNITASTKDRSGNESDKVSVSVIFDDEPPEITINSPNNEMWFYGENQRSISLEGETERNARVNINGRVSVVGRDGKFSLQIRLNEGENEFIIKAEDQAGNSAETKIKVNFSI